MGLDPVDWPARDGISQPSSRVQPEDAFAIRLRAEWFFESPSDFGSGIYTCWSREATQTYAHIEIPRALAVIP
jgi:hypothetical protein